MPPSPSPLKSGCPDSFEPSPNPLVHAKPRDSQGKRRADVRRPMTERRAPQAFDAGSLASACEAYVVQAGVEERSRNIPWSSETKAKIP